MINLGDMADSSAASRRTELIAVIKALCVAADALVVAYGMAAGMVLIYGLIPLTGRSAFIGFLLFVSLLAAGALSYLWSLAAIGLIETALYIERNTRRTDG